jgi:hypothetical protein
MYRRTSRPLLEGGVCERDIAALSFIDWEGPSSILYSVRSRRSKMSSNSLSVIRNMVMSADLKREREKATFEVDRLTNLRDGGSERTERRRQLEAVIERGPTGIFSNESSSYLHRTDRNVCALAKHVRLIKLCRKLGRIGKECSGEVFLSQDFHLLLAALRDDLSMNIGMRSMLIVRMCRVRDNGLEWLRKMQGELWAERWKRWRST